MTWAEFKTQVKANLGAMADTHGASSIIELGIKAGVEDLLSTVIALRRRTRNVPVSSTVTDGCAGYFTISPKAILADLYSTDGDDPTKFRRYTLRQPSELKDLQCGNFPVDARWAVYDQRQGRVWLAPDPVEEGVEVSVIFDALTADFADADEVLFGNTEAEAVAEYVLTKLYLMVDHDANLAGVHQGMYRSLKRRIAGDFNEANISSANIST